MRLSDEQRRIIREEVARVFGDSAEVQLFGSRLDPAIRGGDINLLIRAPFVVTDPQRKSLQLVARLQLRLGDWPIDVLVVDPATEQQRVHREALRMGEPV